MKFEFPSGQILFSPILREKNDLNMPKNSQHWNLDQFVQKSDKFMKNSQYTVHFRI